MPKLNIHFTQAENFILAKHAKTTGLEVGAYVRRMLAIICSDENIGRRVKGLEAGLDTTVSSLVIHMREYPKGSSLRTVVYSFNISVEQHAVATFLSVQKGMTVGAFIRSLAIAPPLPGMPKALTRREVAEAQRLVNEGQQEKEENSVGPVGEGLNDEISEGEDDSWTQKGIRKSKRWSKAEEQLNDLGYVWEGGDWTIPEPKPMTVKIEESYDLIRPFLISTTKKTLPCTVSVRFEKSEEQEARDIASKHGLPLLTYGRVVGVAKGRLAKLNGMGTSALYDFYFGTGEMRKLRSFARQAEMTVEMYLRRRILGGFQVPLLFDEYGHFKLWDVF